MGVVKMIYLMYVVQVGCLQIINLDVVRAQKGCNYTASTGNLHCVLINISEYKTFMKNLSEQNYKINEASWSDCNFPTLPSDFFDFHNYNETTSVDLWNNNISVIEMGVFSKHMPFKNLGLGGNHIKSLQLGIFKNLLNLTSLALSYNELTRLRFGTFSGLKNLTRLDLYENKLLRINFKIFSGLHLLQELYLYSNNLIEIREIRFLRYFSKLKHVHIYYNKDVLCSQIAEFQLILKDLGLEFFNIDDYFEGPNIEGFQCTEFQTKF